MDLQTKIREFISKHQTVGYLLAIMVGGLVLQTLIFLIATIAGGEGGTQLYRRIIGYFLMPGTLGEFIYQPWSLFTYPIFSADPAFAFTYPEDGGKLYGSVAGAGALSIFRLVFDGLLIWGFGRIHQQMLTEQRTRRMSILTFLLVGALVLLLSSALGYEDTHIHYLSGFTAVMIMLAVSSATLVPDYPIQLFLLGRVKIVWVVVVLVIIDFISARFITPVAFSVILGAGLGFLNVYLLRKGTDLTEKIWDFYKDKKVSPPSRMKVAEASRNLRKEDREVETTNGISQEIIDTILDKINENGYDSLSRKEKEILLRASSQDEDEKT
jgi:hypothetical protein